MSKLLSANLARLRKNILFIFCTASMFIFGIISTIMVKRENIKLLYQDNADEISKADKIFGWYIIPVCILLAFICCDFFGEEFDGTIRNKLNVGHTRAQAYTAQFLSCFAAGVIMSLAFLFPAVISGEILLGGFDAEIYELFTYFISSIALTAACASIYCLLVVITARKSTGTTLTVFIMLLIMWTGRQLQMSVNILEKTYRPVLEGGEVTFAYVDNPLYPTGIRRIILEYAYDILPSTQSWQMTCFLQDSVPVEQALRLAAFSIIVASIVFVMGIKIFEQKDLK